MAQLRVKSIQNSFVYKIILTKTIIADRLSLLFDGKVNIFSSSAFIRNINKRSIFIQIIKIDNLLVFIYLLH